MGPALLHLETQAPSRTTIHRSKGQDHGSPDDHVNRLGKNILVGLLRISHIFMQLFTLIMITFFRVWGAQNGLTAMLLKRLVTDEKETQASRHRGVGGQWFQRWSVGEGHDKGPRSSSRRLLGLLKRLRNLDIM